jgi:RNA polymerase sigma factor (sigma-70 family)
MVSTVLSFPSRSSAPASAKINAPSARDHGGGSPSPPPQCRVVTLHDMAIERAAEAQTFEQVVLPHLDAAFRLARWLTRDQSVAEDIVQDACVRALQYFATFRGGDGRAWLLQIVRNTAYTRLQTRRAGVEATFDLRGKETDDEAPWMDVADPNPGPEAALATKQDFAQLEAAVAALPIDLRECLMLREMEELSYKEIAQITDSLIGTVMSRLWRARQLMIASASRIGD